MRGYRPEALASRKVVCRKACTEGSEPANPGSNVYARAREFEGGARSAGY